MAILEDPAVPYVTTMQRRQKSLRPLSRGGILIEGNTYYGRDLKEFLDTFSRMV